VFSPKREKGEIYLMTFKKGNPQIQVRLPDNHWLWEIENSSERNNVVKRALEFYHMFADKIIFIEETTKEIKSTLNNLVLNGSKDKPQQTNDNISNTLNEEILFQNMDKFLNFNPESAVEIVKKDTNKDEIDDFDF
jgi:hypothetical protein